MTSVKTSKRPLQILPILSSSLGKHWPSLLQVQKPFSFHCTQRELQVLFTCDKATFLEITYQCDLWRPVFSIEGVISLIEEGYQPFLQVGFACWAQHENSLLHCGGCAPCHQQTMGHVTGTVSKNHAHNALRQPYTSKWDLLKCIIVLFPFCSAALELP